MKHISDALNGFFSDIDAVMEAADKSSAGTPQLGVAGIATGFSDLDRLTGGFQRSDLIVVAGATSMGKTSLALGVAYGAAVGHGQKVAFFTLETSSGAVVNRILSMETGVDTHRLRLGQIDDNEWDRISRAFGRIGEAGIYIDDTAVNILDICAKARRLHAEQGLDLIILDYLQLVTVDYGASRTQEISEITRRLKVLARELDVPIVALSQLSRSVERRASHMPMLTDLRDSGSIEEDADIVIFIHREDMYEDDSDRKGIAEIRVAKHRNGPVGSINLRFFDRTARFADMELYPGPGM
jgi:replicative DNA helicase